MKTFAYFYFGIIFSIIAFFVLRWIWNFVWVSLRWAYFSIRLSITCWRIRWTIFKLKRYADELHRRKEYIDEVLKDIRARQCRIDRLSKYA